MKTMRQKVKALALCAVCAWGVSPALGETYTLAGKDDPGSTSLAGVCEFIPGDKGNRYFVAGNIEIGPDGTLQLDSQRTTAGDYRTFNLKSTLTWAAIKAASV